MKTFYRLLLGNLVVTATNNFVWFALTYWIYLQTQSVISTGFVGGIFLVTMAVCGFWFGSLVDRYKKKLVMLGSSIASLIFFSLGFLIYVSTPVEVFTRIQSPILWVFALILMCGTMAGSIYGIAIPTLVTVLVKPDARDKANGLFGAVGGIAFAITAVASGTVLGFWGMYWVLVLAVVFTAIALTYMFFVDIPEKEIIHVQKEGSSQGIDVAGTIKMIGSIPGLFALIFFTTFNNFLGGVFMALMDAYGLTLVSVQVWGAIWGVLSFGFIIGGSVIARWGLGRNPLRTLMLVNIVIWIDCIIFTIQPWIGLLIAGMSVWMCLVPFIEAVEQTIIQKVVPAERQGRVFGFAHSVEQSASPLTAFMIGPIAQLIFIPFMTTGRGVDLIGGWFGVGPGRGIALVFITVGIVGLITTIIAMNSKQYKILSKSYIKN